MPVSGDIRLALRFIRQRPLFGGVAILSLAIGIGAATTIFSVANALLLRVQPGIEGADRIVDIGRTTGGRGFDTFSYPELLAMREAPTPLTAIAGWTWRPLSLGTASGGKRVLALLASHNYFEILGVKPHLGRFISAAEDAMPGAGPVVVVSYRFWTEQLGADPGAIGRAIDLNRRSFTVIGVTPPEFVGHTVAAVPDVYLPLTMMGAATPGFDEFDDRFASWFPAIGRLAPGATVEQASAAIKAALSALPQRNTDIRNARSATVIPNAPVPGFGRTLVTAFLGLLFGIVTFVLLIACANVAGMMVARATAREKEIAIRLAIGGSRGHLVGQLLTETLVLFVCGGSAGTLLAVWGTHVLSSLRLPGPIDLTLDFRPDLRVLAFSLILALVTGIVFGLAPAVQASRPDLTASLRNDAARSGSAGGRLRRIFVGGQITLSVVLLASAGLFLRSLQRAAGIDAGFDPRDGWVTMFDLSMDGYDAAGGGSFADRLLERVRSVPGVTAAALSTDLPLDLSDFGSVAYPEDGPIKDRPDGSEGTSFNHVSAGYFDALGVRVLRGRGFRPSDRQGTLPVVVVSRTFAERFWPGEDAVGRLVRFDDRDARPRTVIGVVNDVKNQMLSEQTGPMLYLPLSQAYKPAMTLTVKGRDATVAAGVAKVMREMDPMLSATSPQSLEAYTAVGMLPQRIAAIVTTSLGLVALLLSAMGVYGVIAFMVTQRRREIGVRMALGARRREILAMVLLKGLRIALPGLVIGFVAALALSRLLRGFILGVAPGDPVTFLLMPAVLLLAIVVASLGPAGRASAVEPLTALRNE
jgi:putative ABC transport system permease protein